MSDLKINELIYSDFLSICDKKTLFSELKNAAISKYINNPSKEVQLYAIKLGAWVIEYIKNPCFEAQKMAVEYDGGLISSISNPNEQIQLLAVKQNGLSIKYIKNPSKEVQLQAINNFSHEASFIIYCLPKITDFQVLYKLYNSVKIPVSKEYIQKSPYWKDDASLILEVINE